jgi:NitT/TauT family transport system substrate-binding protein
MIARRTFIAAVGGLLAAERGAFAATPVPPALTTLRIGSAVDDDATPMLYGVQSGTFKRYGLDIQLERAASGSVVAAGVVGGSFDFGKSSITSLSTAHARGLPVLVVAPAGEYDATLPQAIGIVVRNDSPIKTGADLNGKTMGVAALNDFFSLAARAWTDAHGGDASTLKLVEIPMSQGAAAVDTGRLDATILIQPFFHAAQVAGKLRIIGDPSSALGSHFMQSCWFTTQTYAQKNPDVLDRFMKAMRECSAYVNGHHPETADLLAKFAGLESANLQQARIAQGVRLSVAQIQPLIDAQARYKMIPAPFAVRDIIYPPALL